ncbi:MAG TPA: hypothetical protein VFW60_08360 [Rhodanobacteraceae bacterium]|nr:hypothetical protein [Rhodanobacteraceae bacterium]
MRIGGFARRAGLAVAVLAASFWFVPSAFAQTRVHVGVGISVPGITIGAGNCWRCGYWAAPRVYYQPVYAPPVYYAPGRVYYRYGYYPPHYRYYYQRGRYHRRDWRHHRGHYRHENRHDHHGSRRHHGHG